MEKIEAADKIEATSSIEATGGSERAARGVEVSIPGEASGDVKLWIEVRSGPPPSDELVESLAGLITTHLSPHLATKPGEERPRGGLAPAKLARVLAFIEEHISESLPIERLAASVHMSPFHFARLFKQATGNSPHAYLTTRRVARAKQLLSTADLPLVHIASSVGFQTQGHFTEVFRRYAGLTPRHFRLAAKAKTEGEQAWQG
jgi:AraC family transcriptional regulator